MFPYIMHITTCWIWRFTQVATCSTHYRCCDHKWTNLLNNLHLLVWDVKSLILSSHIYIIRCWLCKHIIAYIGQRGDPPRSTSAPPVCVNLSLTYCTVRRGCVLIDAWCDGIRFANDAEVLHVGVYTGTGDEDDQRAAHEQVIPNTAQSHKMWECNYKENRQLRRVNLSSANAQTTENVRKTSEFINLPYSRRIHSRSH